MYHSNRIIIIGGNAAGPSAAAKAKRVNPNAEVILFESGQFISTGTCELPYLLSNDIDDYNKIVFFTPESFFKKKGVKVYVNHFVKSINSKNKEIEVFVKSNNSIVKFNYDKLILTTGSRVNEIKDLPFTLENVFGFKTVHDFIKIKKSLVSENIENVLVIGSGYIGLEVADSLSKVGFHVTILEKEKLPMPSADEEIQYLIQDILLKNKIKFLPYNEKVEFIINNNRLNQILCDGEKINFDLVIVAVGIKPNNKLAIQAGLKIGSMGGLIVDNKLRTSDSNIYAAGDNIEVKNSITKKNDYIPLATLAHSFGHISGENAAGGNKFSEPVIINSSFKLCNNYIAQIGLNYKQALKYFPNAEFVTAVGNNKIKVMPNSTKIFGKLIYDRYSKRLFGASFIGQQEISGYADLISSMIYNKIPATNLAKINFNYTPPLSPFVNLLSILGRKIEEKIL